MSTQPLFKRIFMVLLVLVSVQSSITWAEPLLGNPSLNQIVRGEELQFTWRPGTDGIAPISYQVCVAERGTTCMGNTTRGHQSPKLPGHVRSYRPPNSAVWTLNGRKLSWTVTACGQRAGTSHEVCTTAEEREFSWALPPALPAPALRNPPTDQSLHNHEPVFEWRRVRGADAYVVCVSRPGVSCPTDPANLRSTSNTVVERIGLDKTFKKLNLSTFRGQTMDWTVAACKLRRCTYQQRVWTVQLPIQVITLNPPNLIGPDHNSIFGYKEGITFHWEAVPTATSYKLCLAKPGARCGDARNTKDWQEWPVQTPVIHLGQVPRKVIAKGHANWTVAACRELLEPCQYQANDRLLIVGEKVRLLTYNTFMLPETLSSRGQAQRSSRIPAQLRGRGYDIIGFQELFDDSARQTVLGGIVNEFPQQTPVLGRDRGVEQDGGVVIVSRRGTQVEHDRRDDQRLFGDVCDGTIFGSGDCSADKGVLYAKILINGHPYHIFATHTNSGNGSEKVQVRAQQFDIIQRFIDAIAERNEIRKEREPVLILGDMNVNRYENQEFQDMLSRLHATAPAVVLGNRFTVDSDNNPLVEGCSSYLDYVFYSKDFLQPIYAKVETRIIRSPQPWVLPLPGGGGFSFHDLSDHYGIEATFIFEYPE